MLDPKRTAYLLSLAVVVGLALVQLRTAHMQSVCEMINLKEQEQQLRQELWQQQAELSGSLECPRQIKERIAQLGVSVCAPGETEQTNWLSREELAKNEGR